MSYWKGTFVGADFASLKLHEREKVFKMLAAAAGVDFDPAPYVIMWEDPRDPEAPLRITEPSPVWWAMALHGGILPPVSVYWALAEDESAPDFEKHSKVRGHLLHTTVPMRAMSPEDAITYLIMKDLPRHVWLEHGMNRQVIRVVEREQIPANREFRNAWRLKPEVEHAD